MGLYMSITSMASTIAGMGVGNSGVRQIAEAVGTGDERCISRTIKTLHRASIVLGVIGAMALAAVSYPISRVTFGDASHWVAVAVLSLTVFFGAVQAGQAALVQGMRRVGDLARINVFGALAGTLLGIPVIWLWREAGIVPLLLLVSGCTLFASWWYARRVSVVSVTLTWGEMMRETRALLGLGLAFMLSGLMTAAVAYLTRLIVIREIGLVAVGHYTAAYMVSGIYVGFILQGMGTDFYPRLTAAAKNDGAVNQLVNEQATASLLLAIPGILASLTVAPLVIHLFYSNDFEPAVGILRWQMLGVLGRVASWPMSYVFLAKARSKLFLISEFLANALHLLLVWLGVKIFGLTGTGVAFVGLYLWYWVFCYFAIRRLTGFRWTPANIRLGLLVGGGTLLAFLAAQFLTPNWAMVSGALLTVGASWYSLRSLQRLAGGNPLAAILQKLMGRFSAQASTPS